MMKRSMQYEKIFDEFRAELYQDLEETISSWGGIGNLLGRRLRRRYAVYLVEEMIQAEYAALTSQKNTKVLLRNFARLLSRCPRPLGIERLLTTFLLECLVYGSQLNRVIELLAERRTIYDIHARNPSHGNRFWAEMVGKKRYIILMGMLISIGVKGEQKRKEAKEKLQQRIQQLFERLDSPNR